MRWPFRKNLHAMSRKRSLSIRKWRIESLEARKVMAGTIFDSVSGIDGVNSMVFGIDADQAGNSYVTGFFSGTVDFDPANVDQSLSDVLTSLGQDDIFVAKYTPSGELDWVVQFGSDFVSTSTGLTETGRKIEVDGSGNVVVAGVFRGTAAFGSQTLVSNGNHDVFAVKLNALGEVLWAKSWGGTAADAVAGLDVDLSGNVHLASTTGSGTLEIRKLAPGGTQTWSKSVQNRSPVVLGSDLVVDSAGNIYAQGMFSGTVDFDPSSRVKTSLPVSAQMASEPVSF